MGNDVTHLSQAAVCEDPSPGCSDRSVGGDGSAHAPVPAVAPDAGADELGGDPGDGPPRDHDLSGGPYDRGRALQMRALALRMERLGEQEKSRFSREIHDVLGQELTGLKLDLSWLARRIGKLSDPARDPLLDRLAGMASQIDGCVQTVRRIATGLRPPLLDDLGLEAAVEWQSHEFQVRSSIRMSLSLSENEVRLDRARATALFRIFQELLTNVARHAGATAVSVDLRSEAAADGEMSAVVLEVADNGRGITAAERERADALGLLGMRERLAPFGGAMDLNGEAGRGTRVVVRMPV